MQAGIDNVIWLTTRGLGAFLVSNLVSYKRCGKSSLNQRGKII